MAPQSLASFGALAFSGVALVLSILRTPTNPPQVPSPGVHECVDLRARAQGDELRALLAERDLLIASLARVAQAPAPPPGAHGTSGAPPPPVPADAEPFRYVRIDSPNPALTVKQHPDGAYEIRTTDPSLAGTVIEVTAYGRGGAPEKLFVRVPTSP